MHFFHLADFHFTLEQIRQQMQYLLKMLVPAFWCGNTTRKHSAKRSEYWTVELITAAITDACRSLEVALMSGEKRCPNSSKRVSIL